MSSRKSSWVPSPTIISEGTQENLREIIIKRYLPDAAIINTMAFSNYVTEIPNYYLFL